MFAKVALALLPLLAIAQANYPAGHPTGYKAYPRTIEDQNINAYDKRFVDTQVDETANSKARDTGKNWNDSTLKEQGVKKGTSYNTDDTKYVQLPDDGCGNGGGSKYANSKTGKDVNYETTNKFQTTSGGNTYDNLKVDGNDRTALQREQEYRGYGSEYNNAHTKDVYPYNNQLVAGLGANLPYRPGYAAYGYGAPAYGGWGKGVPAYGWGKGAPAWGKGYPVDSCAAPVVDSCAAPVPACY